MGMFVITHKYWEKEIRLPEGYQWLYVGACQQNERRDGFLYDDIGDNISIKNKNYCELTGLYYLWKNTNFEYIGISHYRRFFTKNSLNSLFDSQRSYVTERELKKYLKWFDCIIARRMYIAEKTVWDQYKMAHNEKDMRCVRKIIEERFPEYLKAFDYTLSLNYFCPYNMIYCRKSLFDSYCEWLFAVLNELEYRIDITNYDQYQARIFGFIAERLLLVWLIKHESKTKELPVVQVGGTKKYRIRLFFEYILKRRLFYKVRNKKEKL